MRKAIFILSVILSISVFSQEEVETVDPYKLQNSYLSKITNAANIAEAIIFAKEDIKSSSLFLIVRGGIAPKIYASDFAFEYNFNVTMINFGSEPIKDEIAAGYNMEVFAFLTENYGTKWLKEIRDDVIGLAIYRSKKESGKSE